MSATREICKCCGAISAVGFSVPDSVWAAAIPARWLLDVLCVACFTRFADEARVQWDEQIEFFPVSRRTFESDENEWAVRRSMTGQ